MKYTRRETGYKRLFISLPVGTSVATFLKEHGGIVSKIYNDFYQRTYTGRPEAKSYKVEEIRRVLKEYKGKRRKGLSLAKLSELIAPRVGIAPSTVKRHYKKVLREAKEGE